MPLEIERNRTQTTPSLPASLPPYLPPISCICTKGRQVSWGPRMSRLHSTLLGSTRLAFILSYKRVSPPLDQSIILYSTCPSMKATKVLVPSHRIDFWVDQLSRNPPPSSLGLLFIPFAAECNLCSMNLWMFRRLRDCVACAICGTVYQCATICCFQTPQQQAALLKPRIINQDRVACGCVRQEEEKRFWWDLNSFFTKFDLCPAT